MKINPTLLGAFYGASTIILLLILYLNKPEEPNIYHIFVDSFRPSTAHMSLSKLENYWEICKNNERAKNFISDSDYIKAVFADFVNNLHSYKWLDRAISNMKKPEKLFYVIMMINQNNCTQDGDNEKLSKIYMYYISSCIDEGIIAPELEPQKLEARDEFIAINSLITYKNNSIQALNNILNQMKNGNKICDIEIL